MSTKQSLVQIRKEKYLKSKICINNSIQTIFSDSFQEFHILIYKTPVIFKIFFQTIIIKELSMSDSDWGADSDTEKKVEETPVIPPAQENQQSGRGRRGRGQKQEEKPKEEEKVEKKEEEKQNDQDDSWTVPQKQGGKQTTQIIKNVTVQESISIVANPNATELDADPAPSSWLDEEKKNENQTGAGRRGRGNRGRGEQNQEQNQGRGRRGNRDRDYGNQQGRGTQEEGGRGGFRGNRGNREEGGFRGNREEGGGGFRGNRGNRQQGQGGYRGNRGNREEGQGGYRGNRGREDGQGGYRGNRNRQDGQGGYRGNRDRQGGNWRGRGGGDRGNRGDRDFGDRGNRDYQDRRNNNQEGERAVKKEAEKNQKLVPQVRRAWPSCQIFVLGKKLSITMRKVQEFNSKILVVPYRNYNLDYYPGNYINSKPFNYREKLIAKGAEIQKPGFAYFQKAVGLDKYECVSFLKIDEKDVEKSIVTGIEEIFKNIARVNLPNGVKLDSIVFPLCEELCEPEYIIRIFIKNLEKCKGIQEAYLITKDPKYFDKCMSAYSKIINEMLDANQISLE